MVRYWGDLDEELESETVGRTHPKNLNFHMNMNMNMNIASQKRAPIFSSYDINCIYFYKYYMISFPLSPRGDCDSVQEIGEC